MKYSEAEMQIKELSSKYSAELNDFSKYFNINYKGSEIAYVDDDERYSITVWKHFSKLPFSNKLYMILAELAMTPLEERVEAKKLYVKVCNNMNGYLNINDLTGKMIITDAAERFGFKTKFTDKDIEKLKQRDDIPLDWNKVTLEEAK